MTAIAAKTNCCRCGRFVECDEASVCFWCRNKERLRVKSLHKPNRPKHPFAYDGSARFVSLRQLHHDTLSLIGLIPPDITAVVGVARSGMAVATLVSMMLHRPLFTIRQTLGDVISCGNGWRLASHHVEPPKGKVVIVDDTVMTGNSLRAIEDVVNQTFPESITAAVYVNPSAHRKPDIWVHDLPWPHLLEWNLFNSILSPNMACDFDGILCHDCQPGQDDDGDRYLDFIVNARPLYTPRRVPIPCVITARIEKYRQPTLAWLKRHGITVHNLIMHPAKTLAERNADDVAAWKAKQYARWNNSHRPRPAPNGFIESDDRQARRIAKLTGLLTICPGSESVYPNGIAIPQPRLMSSIETKPAGTGLVLIPEMHDEIPEPKSDRLVICVVGGDRCEEEFVITGPLMRQYAKKCGADFVSLHGDQSPQWPLGNKHRIVPIVERYEQALHLDCDVVVKPDAPSIFDEHPPDAIYCKDEYEMIKDDKDGDWLQQESDEVADSQGMERIECKSMPNTGVMLIPGRMAYQYRAPEHPIAEHWIADQHLLSLRTKEFGKLDRKWHHSITEHDITQGDSYFIHFHRWDRDTRIEAMRELVNAFRDSAS